MQTVSSPGQLPGNEGHRAGISCAASQHVGTSGILAPSRCEKGRYPGRSAEDAGAASCSRPARLAPPSCLLRLWKRAALRGRDPPEKWRGRVSRHQKENTTGPQHRDGKAGGTGLGAEPAGGLLEGIPVFASGHRPASSPRCPKCRKCTECCPEGGAPGPPRRHPPGGPAPLLTITPFYFSK